MKILMWLHPWCEDYAGNIFRYDVREADGGAWTLVRTGTMFLWRDYGLAIHLLQPQLRIYTNKTVAPIGMMSRRHWGRCFKYWNQRWNVPEGIQWKQSDGSTESYRVGRRFIFSWILKGFYPVWGLSKVQSLGQGHKTRNDLWWRALSLSTVWHTSE